MKKSLIALAALAAVSAASAQSTATISGTYGAGYQSFYNTTASTTSGATAASTNKGFTQTDASVKVDVSEDLGGGLRAAGAVQFAQNPLRGGSLVKEDSSLSLSGAFGTVAYANTRSSNTAIGSQVFASWLPVTSFYSNVDSRVDVDNFSYTTPDLIKGLKAGYTFTEATEGAPTSAGKINTFSATYSNGPVAAAVAYKSYNASAAGTNMSNRSEMFVTYDAGVAKIGAGFSSKLTSTGSALTAYGVSVPMGAITLGVNGASRGSLNFYEAGVVYALSKRTSANIMIGNLEGGDNAGNHSRVGIKHTF